MYPVWSAVSRVVRQLLILLILYTCCRVFFLAYNYQYFSPLSIGTVLELFFYGLRFDISAICFTNILFICLSLLPLPFIQADVYQKSLRWFFIITNSFFLLLNCVDIVYFPFIQKRMYSDTLLFATGGKGRDFYALLPGFIVQYWYIVVFWLALVCFLILSYNYKKKNTIQWRFKTYAGALGVWILFCGLSVLGLRGGLQLAPLNLSHAIKMTEVKYAPVILNAPFSIIKSYKAQVLQQPNYFASEEISACYSGIHKESTSGQMQKLNIVVIIVESLSKEYIGSMGGKSKTPFLDSLFSQSLVFDNAFANGKESIQGIPAVLASIPACMSTPFITSPYSQNRITSFANILKPEGYTTSFYHGGDNGTMGFDAFCNSAGFSNYYGKTEYDNENDYDGHWGIWDEPFLQYTAQSLNQKQQPFFGAIFTLNTHHPFSIPEKYKDRFNQPGIPILRCVQYADFALQRFFETIRSMPWYNNTLFIITADHTGPATDEVSGNRFNMYRIPLIFYKPDGSLKGINHTIAQQIDILPTTLNMLGYSKPFFSMGQNLFDTNCQQTAVNYLAGVYQIIDSNYCYQFDGSKTVALYQWKNDSSFEKNIAGQTKADTLLGRNLKMFVQTFCRSLIDNQMNYSFFK